MRKLYNFNNLLPKEYFKNAHKIDELNLYLRIRFIREIPFLLTRGDDCLLPDFCNNEILRFRPILDFYYNTKQFNSNIREELNSFYDSNENIFNKFINIIYNYNFNKLNSYFKKLKDIINQIPDTKLMFKYSDLWVLFIDLKIPKSYTDSTDAWCDKQKILGIYDEYLEYINHLKTLQNFIKENPEFII